MPWWRLISQVRNLTHPAHARGDNRSMGRRELLNQLPPGPGTPALFNLVGLWKRPTACLERLRP